MIELAHLSYSSISAYLGCPESWRRKYLVKEPTDTTPELIFGTAVHQAVEHHLADGTPLLDHWQTAWQRATEGQVIIWGADTPEHHFNEGVRILGDSKIRAALGAIKVDHDELGPRIERKVELRVPGVPLPIIGYVDFVTADKVPGDLKTAGRAWAPDRAQGELQTLFYLAAFNQAGIPTPGWKFRHYVITKTKSPTLTVFEHQHSAGELMFLFDLIGRIWRAIEHEVFPLNPTGWLCDPKYCSYFSKCRGKYL